MTITTEPVTLSEPAAWSEIQLQVRQIRILTRQIEEEHVGYRSSRLAYQISLCTAHIESALDRIDPYRGTTHHDFAAEQVPEYKTEKDDDR